jgi:hypothetical protein
MVLSRLERVCQCRNLESTLKFEAFSGVSSYSLVELLVRSGNNKQ